MGICLMKIKFRAFFLGCFLCLACSFSVWAQVIDVDPADVQLNDVAPESIVASPQAKILEEAMENLDVPAKIEVIVDSSGSMAQVLERNKSKLFFLKELLKEFMKFQWKEKNEIALRYYGGSPKSSCSDTKIAVGFNDKNLSKMERVIQQLEAGGRTPLHKSLQLAIDDVKSYEGPKRIVIVTDGEDTCGGDPCKTVEEMSHKNLDIKFYVVALGLAGSSDTLKKVKCMGDLHMADSQEQLNSALSQISKKIQNRDNLQVISPNPSAVVHLYEVQEDGKRVLNRVFYASVNQVVPPGRYEAIVGIKPPYKFSEFIVPPKKKVTLRLEGAGKIQVNYFQSLLNAELLNKDDKPVIRFKSDVPTDAPLGKFRLRIFKDPFYEQILPEFYIYPGGEHTFDVSGVGVVRVDRNPMSAVYVYDQEDKLVNKFLTGFPIVLRSGVFTIHVDDKCSFPKQVVPNRKEINVLTCP